MSFLVFTQVVEENFSTTPNQNPATGWTTTTGFSALQVQGGRLVATATTACQASYTGSSFNDDQYLDVILNAANFAQLAGTKFGVRVDSAATQGYYLALTGTVGDGPCTIQITDVGGNPIGASVQQVVHQNDTFRIAAQGNTLLAFQNTVQIIKTSDSQYLNGGSPTVYILDINSHPYTKGISFMDAGNITTGGKYQSNTLLGCYQGNGIDGAEGLGGAFFNPQDLDLLQVIDVNGNIVWHVDFDGDDSPNPTSPTGEALLGKFKGATFAQAFPQPNGGVSDLIQVINNQGQIIWFVDYQGNAIFTTL